MKDFSGKTIYIAGGSSGIGLAIARLLATKGARVAIFARQRDRLESALKQIASCGTSKCQRFSCMQIDVSSGDEVEAVMSRAISVGISILSISVES